MTNFIYSQYVFDNFLLSPINGFKCKSLINNKGTIKKFGFDSIDHLHKLYPNFPLRCISSQLKFNNQKRNGLKNISKNINKKLELYSSNPKLCTNCFTALSYEKKDNKFCSKSCSASHNNTGRVLSISHKKQISNSLLGFVRPKYEKLSCNIILSTCKHCKNIFYNKNKKYLKKYCSKECRVTNTILSRKYINGKRKNIPYHSKHDNLIVNLESSWELTIAEYLDSKNIRWIRPKPIPWIDSKNKSHLYFPDFYLLDYNVYLDPKNQYCIVQDKEKMDKVTSLITLYFGSIEYLISIINSLS